MKVIVDSTVWSLLLRRSKSMISPHSKALFDLVKDNRAVMIGPIRQELLSGIRDHLQFQTLKQKLDAWIDLPIEPNDYIKAAQHFNSCRSKGIQGTHTDFLICAVAEQHKLSILTTDKDFEQYAAVIPIQLYMEP